MQQMNINDIFFSSRIRRKYDVCKVNEELFFPIKRFLDTEIDVQQTANPIPKVLYSKSTALSPSVPSSDSLIIPSNISSDTQSATLTQNLENTSEITLGYDILQVKNCKSYQCPKCNQKISFHPDFVAANLQGCIKCEGAEVLGKRLCEFRGFIFVRAFFKNDHMLEYKCKEGESAHTCKTTLGEFRRGRGCSSCKKESRKKPEREKILTACDCRAKGKCFKASNGRMLLCEHYNFATVYPKLAEDWDYNLNEGVSPYKIPPSCDKEYWFTCKVLKVSYLHCITSRVSSNTLCPYCSGYRVCQGNCLLTTHPELCKEWDYDENKILPTEITSGCDYLASWICREKDGEIHKYKKQVCERTGPHKKGCSKCNWKGYGQYNGGHDYFVAEATRIHNNKYTYPEKYVDMATKITVFCPIISSITSQIHGNFKIMPGSHKKGQGCKKCAREQNSSKGIRYLLSLLQKMNHKYGIEIPFPGMIYKKPLSVDIVLYLTVNNHSLSIAIEFDGLQHVKNTDLWGGEKALQKTQHRDYLKDLYCVNNGICMLRFSEASLPTLEEFQNLIELCKTRQVYKSYPHLQNRVKSETLLTGIHVIETSFLKQK